MRIKTSTERRPHHHRNSRNSGIASIKGGWATLNNNNLYTSGDGIAANLNTLKGLGAIAGGGIEWLTSPIIGPVDTIFGRPLSSLTNGIISPKSFGNDTLLIGSMFVGPEVAFGSRTGSIVAAETAVTAPLNTRIALQGVTDRAVADLAVNPALARRLMSPGSYQHLVEGTSLAPASYGKAVERLTAEYVSVDPALSEILSYQSRPFVSTPDFFGYEGQNLRLLDITTEASRASHLARPYGAYTEFATHPGLPSNLVFPR